MAGPENEWTVIPGEDGAGRRGMVFPTVEEPWDAKARLQRRMEEARESIAHTVGEIKDTVEDQYATAKEAIGGILDWREQFQSDPVVWSVGALSAGFALGYTLGAAKGKGRLGSRHSSVGTFAESLVQEISNLGKHLPMTALDPTLKRVLGFDLSQLFEEMGDIERERTMPRSKGPSRRKASPKKPTSKRRKR